VDLKRNKIYFFISYFVIQLLFAELGFTQERVKSIPFTVAEELYLIDKEYFTMVVDPHWMPIESINEKNEHIGLAADFIKLIQKKGGIEIRLIPTKSWSETVRLAQNREADIISIASETEDRKKYWNFTKTLIQLQTVLATKSDAEAFNSIESILDKPLGIMRGYSHVELLRRKYPEINLVEIDSYEEGFKRVLSDELFGVVGNIAAIGYYIQQEKINTLKIAGRISEDNFLKIAVRNDDPHILSIFNKILSSITEEETQAILNKWLSVRYEHTTDYSLYFKTFLTVVVLFGLFLFWFIKIRLLNQKLKLANVQLSELNKQKDYLFSVIGHDLRNPLTPIIGFSHLLSTDCDSMTYPEIKHQATIIHNKSNTILDILNQIVDWARSELKQVSVTKNPLNLFDLVTQNIQLFKEVAAHKNITIRNTIAQNTFVNSDDTILSAIIRNLISNALKFSYPNSEIIITCFTQSDNKIQLVVQDFGTGMSNETVEKLFQLNPYLSKEGTKNEKGTGLGLLICKQFAESLHAKLLIESEIDRGTKISLVFPSNERTNAEKD
jgi:signal transduction histidine kinase